jgi:hypothetical protein
MSWKPEEVEEAMEHGLDQQGIGDDLAALPLPVVSAIMTRAVELVSARGGTMTSNLLSQVMGHIAAGASDHKTAAQIGQHLVAQGATVATLQANDREALEQLANALGWQDGGPGWQAAIDAVRKLQAKVEAWEKERSEDAERMSRAANAIMELSAEVALLKAELAQAQALNRGLLS